MGVGEGEGAGFIATARPLFHTNFLPDFKQVYLMLPIVFVELSFVQEVPAIDAALAGKSEAINIALINVATRGNFVRNIRRD